jgi:FHA domain-containing protein
VITSYVEMARSSTRGDFIKACPFPFLVGSSALVRPRTPQRTLSGAPSDFDGEQPHTMNAPHPDPSLRASAQGPALVLAVRKVQTAFPAMITVGRTANNDLVLNDVQVSKFHAFFRTAGEGDRRYQLADAGSRNGTAVAGRPLAARGAPVPVAPGDAVRIAHLEFTFVDAGGCWDLIQRFRSTGRGSAAAGPSEK